MAKKAGGQAWLATFADLMSLLMALFVLLFAMSSVEVPKYKAAVESLNEALGNGSELTPEQLQYFQSLQLSDAPEQPKDQPPEQIKEPPETTTLIQSLEPFYESLIKTYAEAGKNNEIKIEYDQDTNEIKLVFPEQIAFDPGRAQLKPRFRQLLREFFDFKGEPVKVRAVGHTDSRPVTGGRFKSNWELSSARASSVIEALLLNGSIQPYQAQAVGVANTDPVALEDTPEAYAKNRRVEILITPEK